MLYQIKVDPQGNYIENEHWAKGIYIDIEQTCNYAEYIGVIEGLSYCVSNSLSNLTIKGDSLIVINQLSDIYLVRSDNLKELHRKVRKC